VLRPSPNHEGHCRQRRRRSLETLRARRGLLVSGAVGRRWSSRGGGVG
jgi:hypothetical protein